MQLPFTFPDWMPWWLQLIIVVAAILVGLVFLMMPFSVFGLKPRLDAMEAQLDEIQADLRALSKRLAEPAAPAAPAVIVETPPPRPVLRAAARVRAEPRLARPEG